METKKNVKVIQEEQGFVLPKSNQFKETFQRLCENKAALAGMVFLILLISVSICADFLFNYQETCVQQNIMERLQWPSWEHPFGTDEFGRDLLARVVHGSRISLSIGFTAVAFGLLVGGFLGTIAGYFGGWIDNIIMRACDVFLAVPMMLMAIVIVAALGASIINLVISLAIASVPTFARLVRSAVLTVRDMEYIEAAKAIGGKSGRTLSRPFLPDTSSSQEARNIRLYACSLPVSREKAAYNETTLAPASLLPRPYNFSSSLSSGWKGSFVQPEAGLTVSICEFSNRVGLFRSKPGETIHRLFPLRCTVCPAACQLCCRKSATAASSRLKEGRLIIPFKVSIAS